MERGTVCRSNPSLNFLAPVKAKFHQKNQNKRKQEKQTCFHLKLYVSRYF